MLEPEDDSAFPLPVMDAEEEVYADYRTTGMSLRSHPLAFHRQEMESLGIIPSGELLHIADGASWLRWRDWFFCVNVPAPPRESPS